MDQDPHRGAVSPSTFVTQVIGVTRPTPGLARITFQGGDLERFESISPDQFVYLLLPPRGRTALTIDADFTWDQYRQMPEEERPAGAYYTVRYHRPELAELDIDVVLHPLESDGAHAGPAPRAPGNFRALDGAAAAWASKALPGDPAALWGPRMAYRPGPVTSWQLLIGDETGLPAIGAILESLPAGTRARALIEVADATCEQEIATSADVEVTWLHRDGAAAGESTVLLDAVRQVEFPEDGTYVWGGGEIRAINSIRRFLREERSLGSEAMSLLVYWRHLDHVDDTTSE